MMFGSLAFGSKKDKITTHPSEVDTVTQSVQGPYRCHVFLSRMRGHGIALIRIADIKCSCLNSLLAISVMKVISVVFLLTLALYALPRGEAWGKLAWQVGKRVMKPTCMGCGGCYEVPDPNSCRCIRTNYNRCGGRRMDMDSFDAFDEVPLRRRLGWKKWLKKGKDLYGRGKGLYTKVKPYYDAYRASQDEDEEYEAYPEMYGYDDEPHV